jgi:hypothetical protein
MPHAPPTLLFGPYRTPRCRAGGVLACADRGRVVVRALSDAPVPWPVAVSPGQQGGRAAPVVCGGLLRALRRESSLAVQHWFGVSPRTVAHWRRALGVPRSDDGTVCLLSAKSLRVYARPEARAKLLTWTDERREKVAASRRGKPMHPTNAAALRVADAKRVYGPEWSRKMAEVQRAQPRAWRPEQLALLGTMPDDQVAEVVGRPRIAVRVKRSRLGIPPFGGWKRPSTDPGRGTPPG